MNLSTLQKIKTREKKRVGRGIGSGKGGHTSGRGQKGQKTRGKVDPLFEGGQLSIIRRIPKLRGFKRAFRHTPKIMNLSKFSAFDSKETVTPDLLVKKGLLKRIPGPGIKILGEGEIKEPLIFEGFLFSASARKKIVEAGGKIS